jgi:Ca2+-binding RTX toxin-like protein
MRKTFIALATLGALIVSLATPTAAAGRILTCTIGGTPGNDRLIGTANRDVICGKAGNDFIKGRGGNDVLFGQGGRDTIISGPGRDLAHGGVRADIVDGNGRGDTLHGDAGNDLLRGFGGPDDLFGGRHRDCLYTVDGVDGNDLANGGPGTADRYDIDPGPPPDTVVNAEIEGSCAGD